MSDCPACGGRLEPWLTARAGEPGKQRHHELTRCDSCGSAFTVEPAEPELYEAGAYAPRQPRAGRGVRTVMRALMAERVRALRRAVAPGAGAVLDVGAGRGGFALVAARHGYDISGIEPSEQGAARAAALGASVQRASIDSARVAPGSLAAATLWHVLEHLDDPRQALERVGGWVGEDGVVVIAVPNVASLQARIGSARWFALDVPRHRSHFTPRGLDALVRAAGLVPVARPRSLPFDGIFPLWQTLANRLTPTPSFLWHFLRRNTRASVPDVLGTLVALALAPLAIVAELAAAACGRGGTIVLVARRATDATRAPSRAPSARPQ